MTDTPQAEILAFLARPDSYGPDVAAVERIDTHISAVFLAGTRVYKLKRAVTLPFLDFSTLERRHSACQAELAINRRTAPDLYLGLEAVVRRPDGALALGGDGETLDWLVVMRRFDQADLFDRMVAEGRLEAAHARALADRVAAFHRAAEPRPAFGGARGLRDTIRSNAACFARCVPDPFDAAATEGLTAASLREVDRLAGLLDARRDAGFVRLCHGDLHLGNICLVDETPVLFDAIEFNDDFAAIDVLYDLAFLLMDLIARERSDLAAVVFNRYFERQNDLGGLPALPLLLSMRAAIRAHVAAETARTGPHPEKRAEALRYLRLAASFLTPPPPRLIAVGGLSGSGKSRLAGALAPEIGAAPGALVLRSDVVRKRLMGVPPEVRLGPDGYAPEMTRRTYTTLAGDAARALAAGHSVIADAVFANEDERRAIEAVAAATGVPFAGLWLDSDLAERQRRVTGRRGDASDATAEIAARQESYHLGALAWTRIDSSGSRAATVAAALETLRARSDSTAPFPGKGVK